MSSFEQISLDQESLNKLAEAIKVFKIVENLIDTLPDGREKYHAISNLELTYFYYSKAIERQYIEKKHSNPDQQILSENLAGLENLKEVLQKLTNQVATQGINLNV